MPRKATDAPAQMFAPAEEPGMKQELYDAFTEQIKAGKVVTHKGRTAPTIAELDFMQYCEMQPVAPPHPDPAPFSAVYPARPAFEFPEGGISTQSPVPAQMDGQPVTGIVPGAAASAETAAAETANPQG